MAWIPILGPRVWETEGLGRWKVDRTELGRPKVDRPFLEGYAAREETSLHRLSLSCGQGSTRPRLARRCCKSWLMFGDQLGKQHRYQRPLKISMAWVDTHIIYPPLLVQMWRISGWANLTPCLRNPKAVPNLRYFWKRNMVDWQIEDYHTP